MTRLVGRLVARVLWLPVPVAAGALLGLVAGMDTVVAAVIDIRDRRKRTVSGP